MSRFALQNIQVTENAIGKLAYSTCYTLPRNLIRQTHAH